MTRKETVFKIGAFELKRMMLPDPWTPAYNRDVESKWERKLRTRGVLYTVWKHRYGYEAGPWMHRMERRYETQFLVSDSNRNLKERWLWIKYFGLIRPIYVYKEYRMTHEIGVEILGRSFSFLTEIYE
jgi:hypothetical protein